MFSRIIAGVFDLVDLSVDIGYLASFYIIVVGFFP